MIDEGVIFSSEYLLIIKKDKEYYVESFKKGMSIEQFNKIISKYPAINITSFMAIKNAILFAPKSSTKFGEEKNKVNIEISRDQLKAYISLCIEDDDLTDNGISKLTAEINRKLGEHGIIFGIKYDVFTKENFINGKQFLIAEGLPAVNGDDSKIRMYKMKDIKPELKQDGNVDHYELNLVNRVRVGDWLGERTDPLQGVHGKTVTGTIIPSVPGKLLPLLYDREVVREVYENGVTTLSSLIDGAVNYRGDKISVSNHTEIAGNVDFKTGNINVDGYLTIKGTVEDNFSVTASKDIEILGEFGVGSVKEITSTGGSVFIKGGISGKTKSVIRAKENIFTKFVADANLNCEGSVNIGLYSLNSNITAKEVLVNTEKGQIIGGNINSEIKVVSASVGSSSEKKTIICVRGFNRNSLKDSLGKTMSEIETLKYEIEKLKNELQFFSNLFSLDPIQKSQQQNIYEKYSKSLENLKLLENTKNRLVGYLRTRGEGEISVTKKIFPGCVFQIKYLTKEFICLNMGKTLYFEDRELKEA